jgi:hypothetical protein
MDYSSKGLFNGWIDWGSNFRKTSSNLSTYTKYKVKTDGSEYHAGIGLIFKKNKTSWMLEF